MFDCLTEYNILTALDTHDLHFLIYMPLSNVAFFVWFQTSVVGNSPFRDRLGSNRAADKPRPRLVGADVWSRAHACVFLCFLVYTWFYIYSSFLQVQNYNLPRLMCISPTAWWWHYLQTLGNGLCWQ